MKQTKKVSAQSIRLLMAGVSFAVYLIAGAIFTLLEKGGGVDTYLWFLILVPGLFILYHLAVGVVSYKLLKSIGLEILYQTIAVALFVLPGVLMDLFGGSLLLSRLKLSDFLLEFGALLSCPILVWTGERIARFFIQLKQPKQ